MSSVRTYLAAALVSIGFCSCGDTFVDPFQNENKIFTIYGFLDPLATTQKIRVIEVSRQPRIILNPQSPEASLDAQVTTTDFTTGQVTTWRHSLERLDDGSYGHVFRAEMLLNDRNTYRLEVKRADGRMASAETTIPTVIGTDLSVRGGVISDGQTGALFQDIEFPQVRSPWEIRVFYTLTLVPSFRVRVYVPYGRFGEPTDTGGWRLRLNITEDQPLVLDRYRELVEQIGYEQDPPFGISSMGVQLRLLDADWAIPGAEYDLDALAQPGTQSNITNGFGYFGSMGLFIDEWQASDVSQALGYDL